MATVTREISIDVSRLNTFQAIIAKQGDYLSRNLKITLTNNGTVIQAEHGDIAVLNVLRSDNTKNGFLGTVNEDGTVTVPLTAWMLELDGVVKCSLSIVDADETRLTTTSFVINVEAIEYTGEGIEEDENYDILLALLATSTDAITGANDAAMSANSAAEAANDAAETANDAAQAAENHPVIGENGNWWVWDGTAGAYADSGLAAQGPQGPQGIQGEQGPKGEKGPKGDKGETGPVGKSAYEIYLDGEGTLTEEQWLASLKATPPTYAESVEWLDELGDTSQVYLMGGGEEGELWAYFGKYTEVIPNQYNAATAKINTRINSSGAEAAYDGTLLTDYIEMDFGGQELPYDVKIRGVTPVITYGSYIVIDYYNSDKEGIRQVTIGDSDDGFVIEGGNFIFSLNFPGRKGSTSFFPEDIEAAKYVRLRIGVKDGDAITWGDVAELFIEFVPKNQEGYLLGWYSTGVKYAAAIEGDVQVPSPTYVDSTEDMTDTSKLYLMSDGEDGYIYVAKSQKTTIPLFTNQIPSAKDSDGNILDGIGYRLNARYNSSRIITVNDGTSYPPSFVTGRIDCKQGDTIRFSGKYIEGNTGGFNNSLYGSGGTFLNAFTPYVLNVTGGSATIGVYPAQGTYLTCKLNEQGQVTEIYVNHASVNSIEFTISGDSANDAIITVNEEILYDEQIEYVFVNTGIKYQPGNYDPDISDLQDAIDETNDRIDNLAIGTTSLPTYWSEAVENLSENIKLRQASGLEAFQFVWFSDMHGKNGYVNSNGAGTSRQTYIGMVSQRVCERYNVPIVITSGDIMPQSSHTAVSSVYQEYVNCNEILKHIDTWRFYATIGNHDGAWGAAVDGVYYLKDIGNNELFNQILRRHVCDFKRVFGGDGTYFYSDSLPQKMRIIMLNSHTDGDGSNDENGFAVYNSMKNSVYGTQQLAWLADVLNSVPDGYGVIAIAHQPLETSVDGGFAAGLLNAYNNRTIYSNSKTYSSTYWGNGLSNEYTNISASGDFTNAKGEFIAFFHGHIHQDAIDTTTYSFPCISITTAGADVRDANPVERIPGTATETAMDIVTIDRKERLIHTTRLGAGSDRQVDY